MITDNVGSIGGVQQRSAGGVQQVVQVEYSSAVWFGGGVQDQGLDGM